MSTSKENHEGHIMLWDELAKTGENDKAEAFYRIFDEEEVPICFCFACEACLDGADRHCENCPISWGVSDETIYLNVIPCTRPGSPYHAWNEAKTKKERKRLAAIIRDLPWKEA